MTGAKKRKKKCLNENDHPPTHTQLDLKHPLTDPCISADANQDKYQENHIIVKLLENKGGILENSQRTKELSHTEQH